MLSCGAKGGYIPRPLGKKRVEAHVERRETHIMAVEEDEVHQAAQQFYAAQTSGLNGDPKPMEELWSHASDVSVLPPSGGRVLGWEQVKASWEHAAQAFSGGQVTLDEVVVVPITEDAAYTMGTERGHRKVGEKTIHFEGRVTNVYRREAGGWKIVHHHTDFSSEMIEALGGQ
jgi:ketosteroid isomerase-like protein